MRCYIKVPIPDNYCLKGVIKLYRNDPKFSDRQAWANSADPDQSDQDLHCLLFRLYRLDSVLYGRAT